LAAGADQGRIKLWDVKTGAEQFPTKGHRASVNSLALTADGATLATASDDGTVKLWDLATGEERRSFRPHWIQSIGVALRPDGRVVASAGFEHTITLSDTASGKVLHTLAIHPQLVFRLSWSPDQNTLASACQDGTVRLWNTESGKEKRCLQGHTAQVGWVCFSPDGERLASADISGIVKVCDPYTGYEQYAVIGDSVAYSPDGATLATTAGDNLHLWDAATGKRLTSFSAPAGTLKSAAWHGDGQLVAAGSSDGKVYLWEVGKGRWPLRTINLNGQTAVHQVLFTPEGRHLITANGNGTVCILRLTPHGAEKAGAP
jgi:WD40 repeat protein